MKKLFLLFCLLSQTCFGQNPNIILILTDDMGYGDLSFMGSPVNHTPHIDRLAKMGTVFNRAYAASAVCTPSRASLLTGKFPLRYDIQWAFTDNEEFLPIEKFNLPQVLKSKAYATAHIGKWHLGGIRIQDFTKRENGEQANPGPHQHGFDHYLANIEDPIVRKDLIKNKLLYREGGKTMVRNDQRVPAQDGNWETIKVDETIAFIEQSTQAFIVNLWFDTPHTPYEPIEPYVKDFEKIGATGDQLKFRSMMKHLDDQIGRLTSYLEDKKLLENTLIIFGSDNGAAFQGSPGPFIGHKTDLHNGGIRVPFFVVWPRKIPSNGYSFQQLHYADILPTICDLLAINTPENLDGQSLWPQWQGKEITEHKTMLWQIDNVGTQLQGLGERPKPYATFAAQKGNWKLMANEEKPLALYDIENEYREGKNYMNEQPEITKALWKEIEIFKSQPRNGWKKD